MKKLLLSSLVLLLFSLSILIFQISCQKDANAKINNTTGLDKIVFVKTTTARKIEIWTANIDGTNQQQVNVSLPAGKEIQFNDVDITSDGSKVIFGVTDSLISANDIYTCNIDGTNLVRIIGNTTPEEFYESVKYY